MTLKHPQGRLKWRAVCLAVVAALSLSAESGLDQLRGLNVSHVKIPFYHKQQLQAMIFALKATNRDQILVGSGIVIELLRKKVDVDLIKDAWELKFYPLRAPLPEVVNFWRSRIRYSEAIVTTERGEIDRQEQIASGNAPVFLRSPLLDLDGKGFFADFAKQTIRVNSDVRIVLRTGKVAGYGLEGGVIPKEYDYIYATSDALHIDMNQRQLILVGNVKISESRFTLDCDRLTVFLDDKNAEKSKNKPGDGNKKNGEEIFKTSAETEISGVSRLFADGDVVITRKQSPDAKPQERQQVFSDHLLYDVKTGKLQLTGDKNDPRMINGSSQILSGKEIILYKDKEQLIINGRCHLESSETDRDGILKKRTIDSDYANFDIRNNVNDFLGNVKVLDPQMRLSCDQMRVALHVTPDRNSTRTPERKIKDSAAEKRSLQGIGDFDALNSGRRELDRIICRNRVVVENLNGAGAPESRLSSDRADLDYRKNLLTFTGNVKIRHTDATLDSDRLEIVLTDRAKGAPATGVVGMEARTTKTIKEATATGKVHMVDKTSTLDTDKLTLEFVPAPRNVQIPGMLQSGGMRLSSIRGDGNVVAVTKETKKDAKTAKKAADSPQKKNPLGSLGTLGKASETRTLKAQHTFTDLLRNRSEFHDQVSLTDDNGTVSCRDLYVYAKPSAPLSGKPAEEDPDAEPFALPVENSAPTQVVLAQGLELEKVICENDVRLTRRDEAGELQQVGGERALYVIADRRVRMTGTPEKRPFLLYGNRRQSCDEIVMHLDTEKLDTNGKTDTEIIGNGGIFPLTSASGAEKAKNTEKK